MRSKWFKVLKMPVNFREVQGARSRRVLAWHWVKRPLNQVNMHKKYISIPN